MHELFTGFNDEESKLCPHTDLFVSMRERNHIQEFIITIGYLQTSIKSCRLKRF